ncbi:hypothetical protein BD414DRAFT_440434 [Trametes punicea]|nr:hypothetical protein BD414DRAFT_440434 [Trametes punicea]
MHPAVSATHRCLLVSEIFQQIAEELYDTGERPTLVQLARTCKALHESVLPILWQNIEGLVPLLKLLPSNTWSQHEHLEGHTILQIDDPDALDWTRFFHYAPHVRHFYWHGPEDVSLLALSALALRRPHDRPLLPQLHSLIWHEIRPQFFAFVHMFLAHTIRNLRIHTTCPEPAAMMALLEHAGKVCLAVETLDVCVRVLDDGAVVCDPGVCEALARYLSRATDLREYYGDIYLPGSCVEALATLPRLQHLELYMLQDDMEAVAAYAARRVSTGGEWFRALDILSLNVARLDASTQTFVSVIQSPSLMDLLLAAQHAPDTHMVKQHLEVVARAPFCACLAGFQLDIDTEWHEIVQPPMLDIGDALKPLYALSQIQHVIVRGPLVIIAPHTLENIAGAWPSLEILSLTSAVVGHHLPSRYCVSLADLAPLARKCPDLFTLKLHLNATVVPDEAAVAQLLGPEGATRCRLRSFTAFDAPIMNPQRVSWFLGKLFPQLRDVAYLGAAMYPMNAHIHFEELWKRVRDCRRTAMKVLPDSPGMAGK